MAENKGKIKITTETTTKTTPKHGSGGGVAGGNIPPPSQGIRQPEAADTPSSPMAGGGQQPVSPQTAQPESQATGGGSGAQTGNQPGAQQAAPQGQTPGGKEAEAINKPEPKSGHSTSPSVSDADLKNKKGVNVPTSKQDLKDKATQKATEPAKKAASNLGKKLARQAVQAVAKLAAQAAAAVIGFFGWWVLAIVAVIAIIIIIFAVYLYAGSASGAIGGKAQPVPGGTASTNPDIKKAVQYSETPIDVAGFTQLVFLKSSDKDYMQNSGKIDARLVKALNYLVSKHKMIRISHIISDYDMMNTNETGSETNPQIIPNITAHKDGLAADTDEIDFVYRVFQESTSCSAASNGLKGDIVYFNDLNAELLRLPCMGNLWDTGKTNTTFNGQPAEAIPIQINWQDCKPNIKHAGDLPDPCTTITDPNEQLVFQQVYQPEARRKVHLAITELLKWPYDSGNKDYYRITQIITYSYDRDVQPFEKDGTLDKIYGLPRPANYGLFYMLEAWQNIHISY